MWAAIMADRAFLTPKMCIRDRDAVDTVTAKITLIMKAEEKHVPVISSMGAGNKLDASAFRVADIYKTKVRCV